MATCDESVRESGPSGGTICQSLCFLLVSAYSGAEYMICDIVVLEVYDY